MPSVHVAVTAIGADRPGIVAAVTRVLFEHDGNIEDSRMAMLGGHFAMMLVVSLPEGSDPATLERALGGPARELDLIVSVRPVAEAGAGAPGAEGPHAEAAGTPYVFSVYGADRPGIVYRVTDALASGGVNITDLATHVVEGETPVYVMIIEGTVPSGADVQALERDLKARAGELGIDISMHPAEADTL